VVVGYDLMVEPNANGVFFDIWEPPDFYPAYTDTTYDWNQFYPPIVEAIRAVDQDTPVLVGGMSFSAVEWLPYLQPTGDPRTVYTFHQYQPMDYTHQEPDEEGNLPNTYPGEMDLDWDGEPDTLDAGWLESLLLPVDEFQGMHDLPVAVNEYGVQRFEPGAAEYIDDLTAIFEDRGINYALWAWTSSQALAYGQMQEFEYRLGPDMENLTEEVPNDLLDVITGYWALNTLRPSGVRFVPAGRRATVLAVQGLIRSIGNYDHYYYSPGRAESASHYRRTVIKSRGIAGRLILAIDADPSSNLNIVIGTAGLDQESARTCCPRSSSR
jgi:hypothetical protein